MCVNESFQVYLNKTNLNFGKSIKENVQNVNQEQPGYKLIGFLITLKQNEQCAQGLIEFYF